MIVVKVYLWPGGDHTRERELASAEIANISDLAPASTYAVLAAEQGSLITGLPTQSAGFEIHNHIRRQSVWALVCAVALKAARQFNEGKGRKVA